MTGSNLKTPKQGTIESLAMVSFNSNLETDSVYWKQAHWKLSSRVQVCWSERAREL